MVDCYASRLSGERSMTNTPTRRDRMRPIEYLGLAAVFGVFIGGVTLLSTREPILALTALGVTFIVAIIVLATLSLTMGVSAEERKDLDDQDKSAGH
jgi:hypothetical protein